MKKKIMDSFNKIKSKFENIKENIALSPEEIKKKEIKNGLEFLINEFKKEWKNSQKDLNTINSINSVSQPMIKIDKGSNLISIKPLDYYYGDNVNPQLINENPILLVAVVGFHHKKGSIIEFVYPSKEEIGKNHCEFFQECLIDTTAFNSSKENAFKEIDKILEDILNQLTYLCLPDAVHNTNEDAQFFFIQNYKTILYGISCYRQLKTKSHEIDHENTRDCVQKAICIVSKIPLFGHFYSKLSSTISAFFNQNTLKDKQIMQELYANYESISFKNINTSEIFMSFSLRKILMFCKEKIFTLIKLIMLEKKIVVYSHTSNNVCSFILSLISLIPGNSLFNLSLGNSVINFKNSLKAYGLPLRVYDSESCLYPLFTLHDYSSIENKKTFLIGTTNQMVINHGKMKYDCVINIDTNKITINNDIPEKVIKLSKAEKNLFNNLYNKVKGNFDDKNENWMLNINVFEPNFEGSDDFIRNEIKNYIYDFLTNLSLAIELVNSSNDEKNNIYFAILNDNKEEKNEIDTDEENNEDSVKKNSNDLLGKRLIEQNEKIKKEQNKKLEKSLKKILSGHNIEFLCMWTQTKNYKIWFESSDKTLCLRSNFVKNAPNITIIYDNGDIFNGSLCKGLRSGFGIFTEYTTKSVYNGSWDNDMRNGTGCLTSLDNKYIYDGEWLDNKRHGQGQLIDNKIKYSGSFKNDQYHGSGILCDDEGNIYEGDFISGLFNGMGHYKTNLGDVYIGQFKNNKFNGKGQLTYRDGSIYNGFFVESKKHGNGLILYNNGDKYEGDFCDDKIDGQGEFTYHDGRIKKGIWKLGELTKEEL